MAIAKRFIAIEETVESEVVADSGAGVSEIVDEGAEISASADEVQSINHDSQTLSRLTDVVEANGALDAVNAPVIEVAVEAIFQRLGIAPRRKLSLENFSTPNNRSTSTNLAVENWKEVVAVASKVVIEALKKLWVWIKDFTTKVIQAISTTEQRARALVRRINKVKPSASVNEIPAGAYIHTLTTSQGFDVEKVVASVDMTDAIVTKKSTFEPNLRAMADLAYDIFVEGSAKYNEFHFDVEGLQTLNEEAPKDMEWHVYTELPGNKVVGVLWPSKDLRGDDVFRLGSSIKGAIFDKNDKLNLNIEKIPVLSIKQIEKISDNILRTCAAIQSPKYLATVQHADMTFIERTVGSYKDAALQHENNGKRLKAVESTLSALVSANFKTFTDISVHATRVTKAALLYAEQSMKQYEPVSE